MTFRSRLLLQRFSELGNQDADKNEERSDCCIDGPAAQVEEVESSETPIPETIIL